MRLRSAVVLAALLALAAPTASASTVTRHAPRNATRGGSIVNGRAAVAGEYPAQGALLVDTDGDGTTDSLWGGTLVGTRQFLTAAHCATPEPPAPATAFPPGRFLVILGDVTPFDAPGQDFY